MGRRLRETEARLLDANSRANRYATELSQVSDTLRSRTAKLDYVQAERDAAQDQLSTVTTRHDSLEAEKARLEAELQEAHLIVALLAGRLLRTGELGTMPKSRVRISESEARRIMADKRVPMVIHDGLTGDTILRLVRPGAPAPWRES